MINSTTEQNIVLELRMNYERLRLGIMKTKFVNKLSETLRLEIKKIRCIEFFSLRVGLELGREKFAKDV